MLFGGRGAFGREDSEAAFAALETAMKKTFPQLEDVRITHRWSGLVSMTLNSLPPADVATVERHAEEGIRHYPNDSIAEEVNAKAKRDPGQISLRWRRS